MYIFGNWLIFVNKLLLLHDMDKIFGRNIEVVMAYLQNRIIIKWKQLPE